LRSPPLRNWALGVFVFAILVPSIFFQLRHLKPRGGDTADTISRVESPFYFFLHAPLVTVGHRALWLVLRDWDWTAAESVALSSAVAGGAFFGALFLISKSLLVWTPILLSKSFFLFLGHVENYAWPFAISLWVIVCAKRFDGRQVWVWISFALLVLGAVCHPMTLMAWPGAVYAFYPWSRKTLIAILTGVILLFGLANFLFLTVETAGHFQNQWILPLTHDEESLNRYGLFSVAHWWEILVLHSLNMPLGILLLLSFGWRKWNGWEGGLILTVCVTLSWSLVWDPTLSFDDWDLFAWPAIFVNLAGGLRWVQIHEEKSVSRRHDPPEAAAIP